MSSPDRSIRAVIYEQTHGDPPARVCLPGSDVKWEGYLLGVEEAVCAAEAYVAETSGEATNG